MTKYITTDPKIMIGAPVIKGTRIPISRIIYLLKEGHTIESINSGYPHLQVKVLKGAIDELFI